MKFGDTPVDEAASQVAEAASRATTERAPQRTPLAA